MTYEQVMKEIHAVGRFESLVQMPEKKDPDWPHWVARASIPGLATKTGITGKGDTDVEALQELLKNLKTI